MDCDRAPCNTLLFYYSSRRTDAAKAFSGTGDKYAEMLEEQALQDTAQGAGTKDESSQPGKRKDKGTPLDLPLKQSIKGEPKGPLSIIPYVNSFLSKVLFVSVLPWYRCLILARM